MDVPHEANYVPVVIISQVLIHQKTKGSNPSLSDLNNYFCRSASGKLCTTMTAKVGDEIGKGGFKLRWWYTKLNCTRGDDKEIFMCWKRFPRFRQNQKETTEVRETPPKMENGVIPVEEHRNRVLDFESVPMKRKDMADAKVVIVREVWEYVMQWGLDEETMVKMSIQELEQLRDFTMQRLLMKTTEELGVGARVNQFAKVMSKQEFPLPKMKTWLEDISLNITHRSLRGYLQRWLSQHCVEGTGWSQGGVVRYKAAWRPTEKLFKEMKLENGRNYYLRLGMEMDESKMYTEREKEKREKKLEKIRRCTHMLTKLKNMKIDTSTTGLECCGRGLKGCDNVKRVIRIM